jgi:uncharacterized cofD-like protein
MRTEGIDRVWIDPSDVRASHDAIAAIAEAEIVVLGPGSLFTSVLPVLLIPEVRAAVAAAPGVRIYACNVAMQPGETEGFDLADHVEALVAHTQADLVDVVLANDRFDGAIAGSEAEADWPADAVHPRWPPAFQPAPRLVTGGVASDLEPHHHDPSRLAVAILRAHEREGPAMRRGRDARAS